jgi:hypothetical protein
MYLECMYNMSSPKVQMTCMCIKPRHIVNYLFRYPCMPVFLQRFEKLVYKNILIIYIYNVDYLIYEPNVMFTLSAKNSFMQL